MIASGILTPWMKIVVLVYTGIYQYIPVYTSIYQKAGPHTWYEEVCTVLH
jgi:hypothetical protein